jgi:hypothetical protein
MSLRQARRVFLEAFHLTIPRTTRCRKAGSEVVSAYYHYHWNRPRFPLKTDFPNDRRYQAFGLAVSAAHRRFVTVETFFHWKRVK